MAIENLTIFDQAPYYDDFNELKNYLRVLFNPGFPVQARELTQIQTILQNQIGSFATNIFQDGSIIVPGGVFVEEKTNYVKLETTFVRNEASFNMRDTARPEYYQNLVGKTLVGVTSGVSGTVIDVIDSIGADPITIYVKYNKRGSIDEKTGDTGETPSDGDQPNNNSESQSSFIFSPDEYLVDEDSQNILGKVKPVGDKPTGYGIRASIDDGIYYVKKTFVQVEKQSIIASKYQSPFNSDVEAAFPSFSVFLRIFETVVSSTDDFTLLDPSTGTPNYNAPGADRYSISLILESSLEQTTQQDTDARRNSDFIEVIRYERGKLTFKKSDSSYSRLMDVLAKRTYEESGDYYLKPFDASLSEPSTGASAFNITLGPSTAYVKGYRIEKIASETFPVAKGRNTRTERDINIPIQYGNYYTVQNVVGFPNINEHEFIQLIGERTYFEDGSPVYDSPQESPLDFITPTVEVKEEYIAGIARVKTFEPDSTPGKFRAYLFDITIVSGGSIDEVIRLESVTTNFSAVIDPNRMELLDIANHTSLFDVTDKGEVKTLIPLDEQGDPESAVTTYQTTRFIDNISLTTDGSDKVLTLNIESSASFDDTNGWRFFVYTSSFSDGKMVNPIETTVGETSATVKFDSANVGSATKCVGTFYAVKNPTSPSQRTLSVVTDHECEEIDTSLYPRNEFGLSVGNVIRINSVETVESPPQDVTSEFTLVKSSRHNMIGNDIIRCKDLNKDFGGVSLVVNVDYISHTQSTELVSVDSYISASIVPEEIPRIMDVSLGNMLDFRPKAGFSTSKKTNGEINNVSGYDNKYILFQADYLSDITLGDEIVCPLFPTGARVASVSYENVSGTNYTIVLSTIPATATSASQTSVSILFVDKSMVSSNGGIEVKPITPNTFVNINYEYYRERQDLVYIDSRGEFGILAGASADRGQSIVPDVPVNAMALYRMKIPSYTYTLDSIDLHRYENKTYTMNDIGDLEKRVENLEYYTTLSLLDKSTADLQIFDEFGNERYKNGFVADGFFSYEVINSQHEDCSVSLKIDDGKMGPQFDKYQINYDIDLNESNNIRVHSNDIITIDYADATYFEQPYASYSEYLNPFDVAIFEGKVTLKPQSDTWYEPNLLPWINDPNYYYYYPYAPLYPGWGYPYDGYGWWLSGYPYAAQNPGACQVQWFDHPIYGYGYHPNRSCFRYGSSGYNEYLYYQNYSWWGYPTYGGYPMGCQSSWINHPYYGYGWHPPRSCFNSYNDWYYYQSRFPHYGYGCTDQWTYVDHPTYGFGYHPPKSCFGAPAWVNESNYVTSGYRTEYENWKFYQTRYPFYNGFYYPFNCDTSVYQNHPNYGWGWHPERSCYSSYNDWYYYKNYSLFGPGCYSYTYDHPNYGSGYHPARSCFQDYNTWYSYKWYGYDAYSWYGYPYYNYYPYWNWNYYRGWHSPYWDPYWWGWQNPNPGVYPWMGSREIMFKAEMLKPNTKYYVKFDGKDVTDWCRRIDERDYNLYYSYDNPNRWYYSSIHYYGYYGIFLGSALPTRHPKGTTELYTDEYGKLYGSLFIPYQTFTTGSKSFRISDDPSHSLDNETASASATFEASGSLAPYYPYYCFGWYDPIAQSFFVDEKEGVFITAVDVYFDKISDTDPVELSIQTMDNGFPTQTTVGGGVKILTPDEIKEQVFPRLEGSYTVPGEDSPEDEGVFQSYEMFINWTNSLVGASYVTPGARLDFTGTFVVRNTNSGISGSMWGSPSGSYVYDGRNAGRIIQHSVPFNVFNDLSIYNRNVVVNVTQMNGTYNVFSRTINGYTSYNLYTSGPSRIDSVIYWDFSLNQPMIVYPFEGTGPFVFTVPGAPEPEPDERTIYVGSPYNAELWNELPQTAKVNIPVRFTFDSPIYLEGDSEYAIRLVSNSIQYQAFVAELGKQDIATDAPIAEQASLGVFFKSQNASTWTADQYKDLKYTMHRARFKNSAILSFKNTEQQREVLSPDSIYAEAGSSVVTITSYNHGLIAGDIVDIGNVNTKGLFGPDALEGQFTVIWSDFDRFTVEVTETGSPENLPVENTYIGGTNASITKNRRIDIARVVSSNVVPENTSMSTDLKMLTAGSLGSTTLPRYNIDIYSDVKRNDLIYFDKPYMIASYDNEQNKLPSEEESLNVVYNLSSSSDNVSPAINTQNNYLEAYSNIVNDPVEIYESSPSSEWFVDDTEAKDTSSLYKYITREIELKEPASAIQVYIGANRPSSESSLKVFYKIKEPGFEGEFDDITWNEMEPESDLRINTNREMFDEVEYAVTEETLNEKTFSSFAIKIVTTTTNTAKPITLTDFRAIAVT